MNLVNSIKNSKASLHHRHSPLNGDRSFPHVITSMWCLDEGVRSSHDSNVVNWASVVEKDQITRLMFSIWNVMAMVVGILCGSESSNHFAGAFIDSILCQSWTVEAHGVSTLLNSTWLSVNSSPTPRIGNALLRSGGRHNGSARRFRVFCWKIRLGYFLMYNFGWNLLTYVKGYENNTNNCFHFCGVFRLI